jgi:ATP-dependent Clp protease adaptor protein ClpS
MSANQTEEKIVIALQPPKMWKVIFLNDNQTPMDFVIELLTEIFKHDQVSAESITLEIHNTGSGVAGVYPYEIAEQKSLEATNIARSNSFPLRIQVEESDE